MPTFEIFSIVILSLGAWLWYDSIRARDICIAAAKVACQADGYQLLDDTVAIAGLKAIRDADGRLSLQRRYSFEYSITGLERRTGGITLLGHTVKSIDIGLRLIKSSATAN